MKTYHCEKCGVDSPVAAWVSHDSCNEDIEATCWECPNCDETQLLAWGEVPERRHVLKYA